MPQLLDNLTYTWNNAGTTFTGIKYNVTDTASAAGSLLMDLQVGGASRFKVDKAGVVEFQNGSLSAPTIRLAAQAANTGIYGDINSFIFARNGTQICRFGASGIEILGDNLQLIIGASSDVRLWRDGAANTLAQRNVTNAQTFRLYNTYTAATDYQRLAVSSATATLTAMSGASVTATGLIPAGAVVVGVTARVSTEITGATGFQIGTSLDADRWADKTGVAVGTTTDNRDWTAGTIECFPAATDVIVTAKTSNFTAGAMRLVVHYIAGEAD